ncbi:MAG: HipA domain-containing protein [Gammaproteobacteria bacterium]|nr:MAG: HipA domain-containing protein [Gammaproteobacteria bacterium]
MIHLYVWLRCPDGAVSLAGELRVADPDSRRGGRLHGEFRYATEYLDDPRAIALDPVHLPLSPRIYDAQRPYAGLHAIFEDSLPDDWGRGVLIRRFTLPRQEQTPPHLLRALGTECLGALAYTATPGWPPGNSHSGAFDLESLIDAAERYDRNPETLSERELDHLFQAASSPGGARPKAVVRYQDENWIAKLRSSRDTVDMVRIEAACLALARQAELTVPEFRLEIMGAHAALLVKRFDITDQQGRYHVASLQTLMGEEGYYVTGYPELADTVRRISCAPEHDLPDLYRQTVFNAALGNTDDHLKNFSMRHGGVGWRLTPAYDLIPDIPQRGEHVLNFGGSNRPTAENLATLAKAFGLSPRKAQSVLRQVAAAFDNWIPVFQDYRVDEKDMARIAPDIERRRRLLPPVSETRPADAAP